MQVVLHVYPYSALHLCMYMGKIVITGEGGTYEIAKHSVVSKEEMGGILFGGAIAVLYSMYMYSVHSHALCRLEP